MAEAGGEDVLDLGDSVGGVGGDDVDVVDGFVGEGWPGTASGGKANGAR